jgi:type IV fimbrial biogenesis protein FimT
MALDKKRHATFSQGIVGTKKPFSFLLVNLSLSHHLLVCFLPLAYSGEVVGIEAKSSIGEELLSVFSNQMKSPQFTRILRESKGFTLGELMAAIGVIGIVCSIGIPSYLSVQPGMRLNGAAREVLGKFMWARAKAVEQNNQYVVTFPTNHTVELLDDKNNNGTADAGESTQTFDIQTDYSDVTLSSTLSTVTFTSRGTGVAAIITITNATGSKTVTVSATGNVKIN